MCGVVGGLGRVDLERIAKLNHRGPDAAGSWQGERFWLGHTRLSIIDLDSRSDQPFRRGRVVLVYNGELWNWRELRVELELEGEGFSTEGDSEVVAAALDRWGEAALLRFEGMFAVAWTDDGGRTLKLARDRYGEVPLHYTRSAFASEVKALGYDASWVPPGSVVRFGETEPEVTTWYNPPNYRLSDEPEEAASRFRGFLARGVAEREVGDVGFCLLLSGGVDSSAVAYHAASGRPDLDAYVAVGGSTSRDLRAAREVAERFRMRLHEVKVPSPTSSDLAEVVRSIEMPHKAQVEIAWACSHLARRIRADGHRVVMSGEGSDELWASYGMAYHGVRAHGWYGFRRRLFRDQHRKNFARCNKVFMREGVECRLPFLSTGLVEYALGLPESAVRSGSRPKAILERAYAGLLPDLVLTRSKMTFQDGAGLQEACASAVSDPTRFYKAEHRRFYGRAEV